MTVTTAHDSLHDQLLTVPLTHWAHSEGVTVSWTLVTQLESLYLQCHSYKYLTQAHKTF